LRVPNAHGAPEFPVRRRPPHGRGHAAATMRPPEPPRFGAVPRRPRRAGCANIARVSGQGASLGVRLRIDFGPRSSIGPGKIALLEGIEASGSLSQAARELGMSYRRAWLLLDDLNHALNEPVATAIIGGAGGGGARLTPFGRELIAAYRDVERASHDAAAARLAGIADRARGAATSGRGGRASPRAGASGIRTVERRPLSRPLATPQASAPSSPRRSSRRSPDRHVRGERRSSPAPTRGGRGRG